ncbi:MAG: UvrD-helicase domain-containing protein, partial [Prevotella shahii]|nr:UvrD-helicase domain-containing protein [Hoylesella shahii]
MHTPLTVYKASAGSGKTFTLAVNYIKILISNPYSYRNILAVTFTNKATEEMKLRILSQLYGIWKLLPSSKGYLDKVTSELDITPEFASKQAGIALSNLLHNYNYFRVETIDTFFQAVLRNLARELDLTANLHVGLNDAQVEQMAVDKLIEELTPTSKVLKWIMEYIQQNIDEDKSWNVIGQIKQFGMNVFRDVYKDNRKQLNALIENEELFDSYVKRVRALDKDAEQRLEQLGNHFFELLDENQLTVNDFSNKDKGVCGYFVKLKNGKGDADEILGKRVLDAMEDPNAWVGKKEQNGDGHTLTVVRNVLFDYLNESEKVRVEQVKMLK